MSLKWVQFKTKQRWRYQATLDAAPDWRFGYQRDSEPVETQTRGRRFEMDCSELLFSQFERIEVQE